jgi:PAS domain S-box-containing protein
MKLFFIKANRKALLTLICLILVAVAENIFALHIGPRPLRVVVDTGMDIGLILISIFLIYHLLKTKAGLEKTKTLQEQLLNVTMDSIIVHDLEGTVIYVNQPAAQDRGYTVEELVGKKIYDLVSPGGPRQQSLKRLHDWNTGDIIERFESVHVHKDGTEFPVEIQGRISQINGQKIFLGVARDITKCKANEFLLQKAYNQVELKVEKRTKQLQEQNARLEVAENLIRRIFYTIPAAVFAINPDGRVSIWNKRCEELFSWTAQEIIWKRLPFLEDKVFMEQFSIYMPELMAGKNVDTCQCRISTKDGRRLQMIGCASPQQDEDGMIYGVMVAMIPLEFKGPQLTLLEKT